MRSSTFKNIRWQAVARGLSIFAVCAVIVGAGVTARPHKAQGQLEVEDFIVWVESGISAIGDTLSSYSEGSLEYKEFILDDIAFMFAKNALSEMVNSTINWINSGFKGSPAFVQDIDGFLANSADKTAGEYIYGSDLNFLCRPFDLDIRIALAVKYADRRKPARCTLSQVIDNVDGFLEGNFSDGGLKGWFSLTTNPNNNFFGASIIAQSEMFGRIQEGKQNNLNELLWGSGMLSKKVCETVEESPGGETIAGVEAPTYQKEICNTVTPGKAISEALTFDLSTGKRTLIEADEINEVISALFQQLAVQALEGANGLLGLSDKGSDGTPSYLDRMGDPRYDRLPGQNSMGDDFISKALRDEYAYRELFAPFVAQAEDILERIEELEALEANKDDDEEWVCTDMTFLRRQAEQIRDEMLKEQSAADTTIATLTALQAGYATTTQAAQFSGPAGEQRLKIADQFMQMRSSGALHTEAVTFRKKPELEPVKKRLSALASQVEASCRKVEHGNDNGDNNGSNSD